MGEPHSSNSVAATIALHAAAPTRRAVPRAVRSALQRLSALLFSVCPHAPARRVRGSARCPSPPARWLHRPACWLHRPADSRPRVPRAGRHGVLRQSPSRLFQQYFYAELWLFLAQQPHRRVCCPRRPVSPPVLLEQQGVRRVCCWSSIGTAPCAAGAAPVSPRVLLKGDYRLTYLGNCVRKLWPATCLAGRR
jgi:hypothetical protein